MAKGVGVAMKRGGQQFQRVGLAIQWGGFIFSRGGLMGGLMGGHRDGVAKGVEFVGFRANPFSYSIPRRWLRGWPQFSKGWLTKVNPRPQVGVGYYLDLIYIYIYIRPPRKTMV